MAAAILASAQAQPQAIQVDIRNGAVPRAQRLLSATQDAQLRIEWRSDRPLTVHLEGYDLSVMVHPGKPEAMEFRARAAGRFAVHAHEGTQRGAHAHGRGALLWLEVHPK
jgi:hypothetical protein